MPREDRLATTFGAALAWRLPPLARHELSQHNRGCAYVVPKDDRQKRKSQKTQLYQMVVLSLYGES